MAQETLVVANPVAGAGKVRRRWRQIQTELERLVGPVSYALTEQRGHAGEIAANAASRGVARVAVVGGDGTVNEVVNGLMTTAAANRPELFVYPAGSGGDLARSIGLGGDRPLESADLTTREVDVGRVQRGEPNHDEPSKCRYFLNIASFGASAAVVERVNRGSKLFGGKVSYFAGTVQGLATYRNRRVRLRIDDQFERELVVNTVVAGNARFFGGGMMIAPHALVDDGLLDFVVVGDLGVVSFLRRAGEIYRGEHLGRDGFWMMRGQKMTIEPVGAAKPVAAETDGESVASAPAIVDVLPRALRVLAPWNRACAV